MMKAAVLGHPVAQSKSPLIHMHWIRKYKLEGEYKAMDVSPGQFEKKAKHILAKDYYAGFNVTVPYKVAALEICDVLDEAAEAIGAVNTVYKKLGKVRGTNTDAFGFTENIKSEAPDFDFETGPAMVLGAGGAARAIVYGLLQEGVPDIRLVNRSRENAEALAADTGYSSRIDVIDWDAREEALDGLNLLVNTTVCGMEGKSALELDLEALPTQALVNDIVYAPLYTPLLQSAKERGNVAVTGIGMLLHQARPAFEKWFGVMPDVDDELMELVMS